MLLRSRQLYPVTAPPIEDGAVLVLDGKIAWVGRWKDRPELRCSALDLGDVVLSPGWVNAHCHLEYSHLARRLPPGDNFVGWILGILQAKKASRLADYREARILGADQLVATGTTTVGDILSVPELWEDRWALNGIRCKPYWEVTGVLRGSEPRALLQDALNRLGSPASAIGDFGSNPGTRLPAGLSPHSPYSTLPGLLAAMATSGGESGVELTLHLAESRAEWEMFTQRRGPLFEWLKAFRPMEDCDGSTPVATVGRAGIFSSRLLAAHVNYLGVGDARTLGTRGVSVVHCPRSHAYFGHDPFPWGELVAEGVNVCLGTDSLASVRSESESAPELSMQAELREWVSRRPDLRPEQAVEMATLSGARALGLEGNAGELKVGAWADLVATPGVDPLKQVAETLIYHRGAVAATWLAGERTNERRRLKNT